MSIFAQVKCPKNLNVHNEYELEIISGLRPRTWNPCGVKIHDGKVFIKLYM